MQVCSIEFPSLKLMRCEVVRGRLTLGWVQFISPSIFLSGCNTASLAHCTARLHRLINGPSKSAISPRIKVSMWIIWMEAREGSSVFSRREIIILLQTHRFLREDICNFLTPKHPSISLQTFYYVWNISFGLEVLQEQPVGCDRSITKRKGNCTSLNFRLKWKSIQKFK